MASFEAILSTVAAGSTVSIAAVSIYGLAVRYRHYGIAPRCAARPKDTIYNPNATSNENKHQDRGSPWFGWIRWTLSLSYETILRGVPGTGTRKNGQEGTFLSANLDAVVFLRFNAMCFRVALLTTVLVMGIILPVNWTANPDYTEVTYNRTTMANIPLLSPNIPILTSKDLLNPKTFLQKVCLNLCSEVSTVQSRLYAIVICAWIVTYYACIELASEWKDILKLRRKHYFESDHYQNRVEQMRKSEKDSVLDSANGMDKRDPWIPHPEYRTNVPNIGLYSLLVGNIPSLPVKDAVDYTAQQQIDWKIALTTAFFDTCVPNQRGFTSAVAAITFLPDATQLTEAWRQWNRTAAALRRLRFIRSIMNDRYPGALKEYNTDRGIKKSPLMTNKVYTTTQIEQRVIHFHEQSYDDIESFLRELNYGPEQIDIYGFHYAQAASGCCPYGFGEYIIRRITDLDKLLELERDALQNVQQTRQLLMKAQSQAAVKIPRSSCAYDRISNSLINKTLMSQNEEHLYQTDNKENQYRIDGVFYSPSKPLLRQLHNCCSIKDMTKCCKSTYKFRQQSSFAVITFTSRQAAATVRQSLIDGRGGTNWKQVSSIPVPPLADAAPFSCFNARDWFRPVTPTIFLQQKVIRQWSKNVLLVLMNLFYTLPLTYIASLSNQPIMAAIFPNNNSKDALDGIIYAFLYSLFISICPTIFQFLANYGSLASSVSRAELAAMKYYWIFINVTVFTGVNFANLIMAAWAGGKITPDVYEVMEAVAHTIPVSISFNWLNIIIKMTTFSMPIFYLLQAHFSLPIFLGCRWSDNIARLLLGGGAGGPVPYSAYIDNGTVFLCVVTLSFVSPLVAPFATIFFMISEPIWRRSFIYVYLPEYDGGGFRWHFFSEMCFSSLIYGQVLLTLLISFKRAIGPSFASAISIVPTLMFRRMSLDRYMRAFSDTALLQTSTVDSWDTSQPTSIKQREDFRRFLVDAHKAAYIPVCIAGSASNNLTAEPATVIPLQTDARTRSDGTVNEQVLVDQFEDTALLGADHKQNRYE